MQVASRFWISFLALEAVRRHHYSKLCRTLEGTYRDMILGMCQEGPLESLLMVEVEVAVVGEVEGAEGVKLVLQGEGRRLGVSESVGNSIENYMMEHRLQNNHSHKQGEEEVAVAVHNIGGCKRVRTLMGNRCRMLVALES